MNEARFCKNCDIRYDFKYDRNNLNNYDLCYHCQMMPKKKENNWWDIFNLF